MKDKVETLLGFAVKAGKVFYGSDTLETVRSKYYIIVLCNTASDNTKKRVLSVAKKKRLPVIVTEKELQYTVGKPNCKVLAVADKQMAEAILGFAGENYRLIRSEVE